MTSVINDVKEALGLIPDDDSFDMELKMHINAAFSTMYQNGVGNPIYIEGVEDTWDKFEEMLRTENEYMYAQVKQYVFLKTKLLFDPPPPSTVEYVSNAAEEMLWRLRENYDILEECRDEP